MGSLIKNIKIIIQETEEEVDLGDFVNDVINFEESAKKEKEEEVESTP